ncbi:MAG: alpha/beta hydrolase [Melioribacter sp.]|nr:alpha/beta hydrolase [Melioribacter sp.]
MKRIYFIMLLILFVSYTGNFLVFAQTEKVKSVDGVEISFDMAGNGDTGLVFVHGWSCDKSYWHNQAEFFSDNYKVVAIDLAGHGNSGMNRKDYTMELFGEDVAAVVNHLKLNKVILIGHSMGGSVILEAAKKLGNKVIGIIGVDTYQSFVDNWTSEQKDGFLKSFQDNFVLTTKGFVRSMFPPNADTMLVNKVVDDMSSAPPEVAVSAMRNLFYYDPVPTLRNLNPPLISINCDMYPVSIEENKKYVKDYEVKFMKGVGHFLMLERPDEFNGLLKGSIAELLNK